MGTHLPIKMYGLDEEIGKKFEEIRADFKRRGSIIEGLDLCSYWQSARALGSLMPGGEVFFLSFC